MPPRGTRRGALVAPIRTGNAKADRAAVADAAKVNRLIRGTFAQAVALEVELVAGVNRVGHGIGAPIAHFISTAVDTIGAAVTSAQADNPRPDQQVWIHLAGAARCRALLFLLPQVS